MTITDSDGWSYIRDEYGDWRGANAAGTLRTRLKRDRNECSRLDAARKDAQSGRHQRLIAGAWVDRIDVFDKRTRGTT